MWVLFWSLLIDGVGYSMIGPYILLFLKQDLGTAMTVGGLILTVAGVIGAAGNMVGGLMSDRYGRRGVMVYSMLLRCITFLLLAILVTFDPDLLLIAVLLLLSYFFGGVFQPANNAMVADVTDPARRMEAYGLLRVAWNVGFAVGPIMGGVLIAFSFPLTFAISAIISLFAALMVAFMLTESYVPKPNMSSGEERVWGDLKPVFLLFCLFSLPLFIMSGQFGSTYTVYANERVGIDTAIIGLVFGLNGVMVVLLQMPISRWLAERDPYIGMLVGSLVYSAGYLLVAAVTDGYWLAMTMIIITLGEIIVVPVSNALTVLLAPEDSRGKYLGVFGVVTSFGWFGSTFIGGVLYDTFENGWVMWGIISSFGLMTALAMVPLWLSSRIITIKKPE